MRTTVVAVVIAAGVALVLGGRLANLPSERPRWWWLAPAAVVALITGPLFGIEEAGLAVAVLVALIAFALANLRLVGMGVVLTGLVLNAVVILANGAMPVDPGAVVATGIARPDELDTLDLGPARRWREPSDRLPVLADIVPIAALGEVVSFGDLVLAAGLANVTFRLLRPVAPRRGRAPRHRRPLVSLPSPAR